MHLKSVLAAVVGATLLASCAPVQTGGAGTLTNGEPVSATITADQMNGLFTFALISPRGWTCSGTVGIASEPTAVRTVPMTCSDGATGNMVVTGNQFADQIVGSFRLSNGRTGQVTFGSTV